jgi:hypothetical protein
MHWMAFGIAFELSTGTSTIQRWRFETEVLNRHRCDFGLSTRMYIYSFTSVLLLYYDTPTKNRRHSVRSCDPTTVGH